MDYFSSNTSCNSVKSGSIHSLDGSGGKMIRPYWLNKLYIYIYIYIYINSQVGYDWQAECMLDAPGLNHFPQKLTTQTLMPVTPN